MINLVKKNKKLEKYTKDKYIIAWRSNEEFNSFKYHILDIGNMIPIISQGTTIEKAIYAIITYHDSDYPRFDGNKNEKLSRLLLKSGFPSIEKSKININVINPATYKIMYVVLSWNKEDIVEV